MTRMATLFSQTLSGNRPQWTSICCLVAVASALLLPVLDALGQDVDGEGLNLPKRFIPG